MIIGRLSATVQKPPSFLDATEGRQRVTTRDRPHLVLTTNERTTNYHQA